MSAREEILDRVRTALSHNDSDISPAEPPRAYRRTSGWPPGAQPLLDRFTERVEDYQATVAVCDDDDTSIGTAVRSALFARDVHRVVVPSGLPPWVGHDDTVVDDGTLSAHDLDRVDAVVTGCALAIAETGSLLLDGSPLCGRRIITLVPDVYVCVVHAEQVVGSVPEAVARVDPTRPLTFVSGPSATSDIELSRVEGVHGPRTLHVVLAIPPP
jgi:L-lactate dehydrogenase complex protein LldG